MLLNSVSLLGNVALVIAELMSMVHWWNGTGRKDLKYYEKNLSKWYFIQQKSHEWPGIEPGLLRWEAGC